MPTTSDDQDALFPVETPPVKTPPRPKSSGPKRPAWTKYVTKTGMKCDDCMLVLALAKGEAPASRQARWRRKQGETDLLLCYAHAQERRIEDGLDPLGALP